jgi:hypothetical protein
MSLVRFGVMPVTSFQLFVNMHEGDRGYGKRDKKPEAKRNRSQNVERDNYDKEKQELPLDALGQLGALFEASMTGVPSKTANRAIEKRIAK